MLDFKEKFSPILRSLAAIREASIRRAVEIDEASISRWLSEPPGKGPPVSFSDGIENLFQIAVTDDGYSFIFYEDGLDFSSEKFSVRYVDKVPIDGNFMYKCFPKNIYFGCGVRLYTSYDAKNPGRTFWSASCNGKVIVLNDFDSRKWYYRCPVKFFYPDFMSYLKGIIEDPFNKLIFRDYLEENRPEKLEEFEAIFEGRIQNHWR